MITSFADKDTKGLWETGQSRRFKNVEHVALRKLDMLNAAVNLNALRVPPSNHLEALKGDRAGQYSIRINAQWRLCFTWSSDGAHNVEICDYR